MSFRRSEGGGDLQVYAKLIFPHYLVYLIFTPLDVHLFYEKFKKFFFFSIAQRNRETPYYCKDFENV